MNIFNQNQINQFTELLIASTAEVALSCQNTECNFGKEIGKLGGAINFGNDFPNEPMSEVLSFMKSQNDRINWVLDKFVAYVESDEPPLDLLSECRSTLKNFSEGDVILIFSGLFGILEEIGNSCLEISDEQKTATSFIFSNLYEMTPELAKKIAEKWREIKLINFL
jgi:hypothetical protein